MAVKTLKIECAMKRIIKKEKNIEIPEEWLEEMVEAFSYDNIWEDDDIISFL